MFVLQWLKINQSLAILLKPHQSKLKNEGVINWTKKSTYLLCQWLTVDDRIYKNGDLVILKVSSEVSGLGMGPVAGLFQKVNPVLDSEKGWEFP